MADICRLRIFVLGNGAVRGMSVDGGEDSSSLRFPRNDNGNGIASLGMTEGDYSWFHFGDRLEKYRRLA